MPTMSSLARSLNSVPSRWDSSPPKTRCSNCFCAVSVDIADPQERRRISAKGSTEFVLPLAHEVDERPMTRTAGGHKGLMTGFRPIIGGHFTRQSRQSPARFVHQKISGRKVPIAAVPGHECGV